MCIIFTFFWYLDLGVTAKCRQIQTIDRLNASISSQNFQNEVDVIISLVVRSDIPLVIDDSSIPDSLPNSK